MNQVGADLGPKNKAVEKIRGRQVLGENLPPGDSDWGNLTIASQEINPDVAIVRRPEHSFQLIYGNIAKEHQERDKDV
jgi:hypothetical protein